MLSVTDFLKAVNEGRRAMGTTAFVVDFGGVENIDDPTVARVLLEHFEHAAAEITPSIARIGRHEVACLCPDGRAGELASGADELAEIVREQSLGAIRTERYSLPRDGRALADRIRIIVSAVDPNKAAGLRRTRRNDIAQLLRTEQMLRQADISALLHHQAVYDFAKPRHPVTLARELTVSLERLAERLGIDLAGNPWLFDKVTLLLDRRMLFHLMQDRRPHAEPFAINLRVATVLDHGFPEIVGRLAAQEHETLIVELPEGDRAADPEAFEKAVRELDRLGIHIAFHVGGWNALRGLVDAAGGHESWLLRAIDFLKVRWDATDLDLTAAETGALAKLVSEVGSARVVLERAEGEEAITFGLKIGLRLMQGFGVTGHVQAQQAKEHDRAAARTQRNARREAEPEPKADAGGGSALRKMFKF